MDTGDGKKFLKEDTMGSVMKRERIKAKKENSNINLRCYISLQGKGGNFGIFYSYLGDYHGLFCEDLEPDDFD